MNKTRLVEQVAERAGLPRTQATRAVDALLEAVQGAISKGEEVRING